MWRTRTLGFAATVLVVLVGGCTAVPHYGSPSPRTYYLSARGDDSADGTSKDEAWRSLGRASQVTLRPGDHLLLEGGSRFAGTITVGNDEAGDADRPVVIDSYGNGRATVVATNSAGVSVHNTAGVEVHDLILRGRGSARTSQAGVNLYNDTPTDARHAGVNVSDIDAAGFQVGIGVGSTITGTGFADVTIRRARVHGNKDTGLLTYGPQFDDGRPSYAHEHITIEDVQSYGNPGDPNALYRPTGNGIVLGAVRDATVRDSSAHDNGTQAPAEAQYGPAGIWTYDSRDVLIEHSAAYRNHTGSRMDGAGFGFDTSVFDSTLQYNLSFENDGSGFYIFSRWPHPHSGNTVRYNISSNDARKMPEHGGLTIHGSRIKDLQVYQNTVIMGRSSEGEGAAVRVRPGNSSVSVRNNLIATDGDPLVVSDTDLSTSQVVFQGNQFHTADGQWTVAWGDRRYFNLRSWREDTGQERLDGRPTGTAASPCFDEGSLPDIQSPAEARRVIPGCPHAGLDLQKHFGVVPVKVDYFGHVVTAPPNTGAAQP
ncbi:right-handed parallel beta-helix repeat-containing protein [Streptomyces chartreusis]|uniref:right-handed parallel beta-helix repeat-containing protein n=1 Tax=Streptomyces chartreusis TaxID=1969 RepID=UPI0033E9EAE2